MMQPKIQPLERLAPIVHTQRQAGKQLVFTNGCFDLLHVGHIRYLDQAKRLGDILIIGLNSDRSVRSLEKGERRPIVNEHERAEVLAALDCVDFVTVFDDPDPLMVIQTLLPNVLVKGGDWSPEQIIGREVVEAHGGSVVSIPLVPNISTTRLIERIINLHSTSKREYHLGENPIKNTSQEDVEQC